MPYEAIFYEQTSTTQKLADKAAWIASLSLDETEIEEPDKITRFTAGCVRLATAADELELFITDSLNRYNYEVLKKPPETALTLAIAKGELWKNKKQKDLELVKNLKRISSWDAIFNGQDKDRLIQIIEQHFTDNTHFRLLVDHAAFQRISYITELALKGKLSGLVSIEEMYKKFKAYIIEECEPVNYFV